MRVQSPWHMSACRLCVAFTIVKKEWLDLRCLAVVGASCLSALQAFYVLCCLGYVPADHLCCFAQQWRVFSRTLFMGTCSAPLACKWNLNGFFFFFLTLYTVLNFVCQSYWIEFALLPDLMSLNVFDEWLCSWTITLRSLSLFVLYVHRAKSLQYIRAVPWKKVFMLPFRLTRVLFGFRCIPDALLWNDSAFLARSSLRREYILSDA